MKIASLKVRSRASLPKLRREQRPPDRVADSRSCCDSSIPTEFAACSSVVPISKRQFASYSLPLQLRRSRLFASFTSCWVIVDAPETICRDRKFPCARGNGRAPVNATVLIKASVLQRHGLRGSHGPICSSATGIGCALPVTRVRHSAARQSSSVNVPLGDFCSSLGKWKEPTHVTSVVTKTRDSRAAPVFPPLPFEKRRGRLMRIHSGN